MISALSRQADGTIELTITIPKKRVSVAYENVLNQFVKNAIIKGFRKGKAPSKTVEEKIGKSKIYEEVLKTLVTEVYLEAIKEQNVKPIISPQVSAVSLDEGKDWQIKAVTCELPKVELRNYKEGVKKALASEKIWVPGQDKDKKTAEKESEQLGKIFQTLLQIANVQIPELLIQEEINRMLSRLIDQTGRLGLTVEQYLASVGKTSEKLRQEYRQQAEESLKLELILSAIAEEEKVEVKDEEVKKMIDSAPDEKSKKEMETPIQRAYIRQLLRKRKVIDNLTKL